jgi:membrane-associated protein
MNSTTSTTVPRYARPFPGHEPFTRVSYNAPMDAGWLIDLAGSGWLLPLLYLLVVADAFLVVLPSETAVVALAALSASSGGPPPVAVILVAAAGAMTGDLICYLLGRRIGLERWAWQRRGRVARPIARAEVAIATRPAVLLFTARYVPFARIAVNLTAGAGGLPLRRFLPLAAGAGCCWALYNVAVGSVAGAVLADQPLLALAVSVVVAVALGLAVDAVVGHLARRRTRRATADARSQGA